MEDSLNLVTVVAEAEVAMHTLEMAVRDTW